MTQSIQVLDQRTQRDLQYVEKMEVQLRGLETKFRQVEENHKQNIAKQYKVPGKTGSFGAAESAPIPSPAMHEPTPTALLSECVCACGCVRVFVPAGFVQPMSTLTK